MQKMIAIVGPTASGKSEIAIHLAQRNRGEIISADSRQIYRGMDIGSGKEPGRLSTAQTRGPYTRQAYISHGIPHYMIDIRHPNTPFNVQQFVTLAQKISTDITNRDKQVIIAGGTMFWAQALLEQKNFAPVPPRPAFRKKLSTQSPETLFALLEKKDPRRAKDISDKNEIHNTHRIIRALEIIDTLGYVPKEHTTPTTTTHCIIAVDHPKDVLHHRIEQRMHTWFRHGIFDEILTLHNDLHVPWKRLESFGLEYKWCTRYVRGEMTFRTMQEQTQRDLKKYAKRQMTWLRRWERHGTKIHHITTAKEADQIVQKFLTHTQ